MAVELVPYKTLYGDNVVQVFSGVEEGLAADAVNHMIMAMADAVEDLEEGVQGPPGADGQDGQDGEDGQDGFSPTVTASKAGTVTTITITDINGTTTTTINDGVTGWTEGTLVDGSNTLTDADSLYSATGMSGASITVGASWATGHTARVGITFAASSTFSYPSGWVCVGDDCSGGDFTFSQGSSYWLTIECRPDGTWMTCQKVPA